MRPKDNATNLDMIALPGVDVVHDVENGLPFPDETFYYIEAEDVLEHVDDIIKVMQEIWRVLKPGGRVWIRGPHGSYPEQAWKDPTHKRLFVPGTFNNWDPTTPDGKHYGHYFGKGKFKVLKEVEINKGMEYTLGKI